MKNKSNIPPTIHYLNNILSKSQFSGGTNKLFDGLVIPPGFSVNKIQPSSNNKLQCDNECIDDKIYLNLIKLAGEHNTTPKKKKEKKKKKNTRKVKG